MGVACRVVLCRKRRDPRLDELACFRFDDDWDQKHTTGTSASHPRASNPRQGYLVEEELYKGDWMSLCGWV